MINFADRAKNPSIGTARSVCFLNIMYAISLTYFHQQMLHILQSHYPERLGLALIINVPFLLNAFYKMITPFIDPVTRDKMRFNPRAVEDGLFARPALWREFGGAVDFAYDHAVYWPAFVRLAAERRASMLERWRELGAKVGLREWDIKGGRTETKEAPEAAAA